MDASRIDPCIFRLSDVKAEHQRQPYSDEQLVKVETAVITEIARTHATRLPDDVLKFAYSRNDLHPSLDELLRAARSEDAIEKYRAVAYLHYLSDWDLAPTAWDAMAEFLLDSRNPDVLRGLALRMLLDYPDRGGSDLRDVFLQVIKRDPAWTVRLARSLAEIRSPVEVLAYAAEDRTFPPQTRADWLWGSSMSSRSSTPPSPELVEALWAFAESDADYEVRQSAADALKRLNQRRPWRTVLESKRLHHDLKENGKLALLFAPAVFMLFGWVVLRRWLILVWVLLSFWLTLLYIGLFGGGVAHGHVPYFRETLAAIMITFVVQIGLFILGLRQRRARRIERSYIAASEL